MINKNNNNNNNNYDNTLKEQFDPHEKFDISEQFEEIKNLSKKIDFLFEVNKNIEPNILEPIEFNYTFKKELAHGFIEYKRTLATYNTNSKIDKLIRQIYWRIYEGLVTDNTSLCYYMIGVEDSGEPSYLNDSELTKSINFISSNLLETDISFKYKFLINSETKYKFAVVKFWIKADGNKIEYF